MSGNIGGTRNLPNKVFNYFSIVFILRERGGRERGEREREERERGEGGEREGREREERERESGLYMVIFAPH